MNSVDIVMLMKKGILLHAGAITDAVSIELAGHLVDTVHAQAGTLTDNVSQQLTQLLYHQHYQGNPQHLEEVLQLLHFPVPLALNFHLLMPLLHKVKKEVKHLPVGCLGGYPHNSSFLKPCS